VIERTPPRRPRRRVRAQIEMSRDHAGRGPGSRAWARQQQQAQGHATSRTGHAVAPLPPQHAPRRAGPTTDLDIGARSRRSMDASDWPRAAGRRTIRGRQTGPPLAATVKRQPHRLATWKRRTGPELTRRRARREGGRRHPRDGSTDEGRRPAPRQARQQRWTSPIRFGPRTQGHALSQRTGEVTSIKTGRRNRPQPIPSPRPAAVRS